MKLKCTLLFSDNHITLNQVKTFTDRKYAVLNTSHFPEAMLSPVLSLFYLPYKNLHICHLLVRIPKCGGFILHSSYFVVLPNPPFLTSVTSSSIVIPYSTKIPCINPVPSESSTIFPSFVSFCQFLQKYALHCPNKSNHCR